jgi:putative transposase
MHFEPNHIYHVYNRGNNKTPIFFNKENYLFLLRKIRKEWLAYCDIFCYCLMPNHFHFMLLAKPEGCETILLKEKATDLQVLSKTIGKTLSSYTQAINIQNKTTGNLFQKKTKAKCLTDLSVDVTEFPVTEYLLNCFYYIHFNPIEAKLEKRLEEWPYSSWPDYYGFRNGDLCSKEKAIKTLGLTSFDYKTFDDFIFNEKIMERIW